MTGHKNRGRGTGDMGRNTSYKSKKTDFDLRITGYE